MGGSSSVDIGEFMSDNFVSRKISIGRRGENLKSSKPCLGVCRRAQVADLNRCASSELCSIKALNLTLSAILSVCPASPTLLRHGMRKLLILTRF